MCEGEEVQPQPRNSNWGPPQGRCRAVHSFTRTPRHVNKIETPSHQTQHSAQYFTRFIQLLVEQTNLYYLQYLDLHNARPKFLLPPPLPEVIMTVLKATICTWGIEWQIAMWWTDIHSNAQRYAFICLTCPFWIGVSCVHLVVLRSLEISESLR